MYSVSSGVVKILSILEFKGGQSCQYSKCKAEVLPRGAWAGGAFETVCPRTGARRRNTQGTHGKSYVPDQGLRKDKAGGNLLSMNPFCPVVPWGVPWFCPPWRR